MIPQTSTIASHMPRAMGVGFAIELAVPDEDWVEELL